jgi:hypothetical protein
MKMRRNVHALFAFAALAAAPLAFAVGALPEPDYRYSEGVGYGAPVPIAKPLGIKAAAVAPESHAGVAGLYYGRITEVCQKEGCWVVLEEDGVSARVMFADHAFSVPKDATGNAIVQGTLEAVPVDAAQARHLEEDGAAAPAARELRIVATGIHVFGTGLETPASSK